MYGVSAIRVRLDAFITLASTFGSPVCSGQFGHLDWSHRCSRFLMCMIGWDMDVDLGGGNGAFKTWVGTGYHIDNFFLHIDRFLSWHSDLGSAF